MRVEAAFHFLFSQTFSAPTQIPCRLSQLVFIFMNSIWDFLSKQRWGCHAGYLSALIKVCPICLFSSKAFVVEIRLNADTIACDFFYYIYFPFQIIALHAGGFTQLSSLKIMPPLINRWQRMTPCAGNASSSLKLCLKSSCFCYFIDSFIYKPVTKQTLNILFNILHPGRAGTQVIC